MYTETVLIWCPVSPSQPPPPRPHPLHMGGRVVRCCCVNFQCRGVLLIWIIVGQGPTALAAGAGGGCLEISSLIYHSSLLSPSLWETARYRLKYCLKEPLSLKQPTSQTSWVPSVIRKIDIVFIYVHDFFYCHILIDQYWTFINLLYRNVS